MNKKSKRYPLNGTFELTGRCNLSCRMCLVRVDQNRIRELGFRERTTEEWIHMAEQAAEAGTLNLLLTGGEVLIRPDFCEIYEAIAKMGFLLTVYTNATRKGRNRVCGRDQRKAGTGHLPGVRAEEPAALYAVEIKSQRRLCGGA